MEAALGNAYKQAKQQVNKLTKQQYTSNLLGSSLEELAKQSTAKELPGPDHRANAQFIEAINSSSDGQSEHVASELLGVLKRRLAMDNAHKQWLAVCLISDVLRQAPNVLRTPHKQELLNCVAEITKHPSHKTVNPNRESVSQSIRKAKSAAIELLRSHGTTGQNALRQVAGLGGAADAQRALQQSLEAHQAAGSNGTSRSWEAIVRDTTTAIETIKGHCELVNELLLADSPGDFETGLINELMTEMAMYSSTFEPLLGQLASFETPEAESLMAQALEAYDLISSCQQLASDVAQARATGVDGTESFSSPSQQQQQPGAGSSSTPELAKMSSFDALGLGELQTALDSAAAGNQQLTAAAAGAGVDPFLAVAAGDPFASSSQNPAAANASNPFGAPSAVAPPPPPQQQQASAVDPFAAMATSQDPFAAPAPAAMSVSQPQPVAAVDPFAAMATGQDPFASAAGPSNPFGAPSPPPPPQAPIPQAPADDPFAALVAPTSKPTRAPPPPPPPTGGHLTPDALLADLTKAPKATGTVPQGVPMKAAAGYSANNPFAQQ